jgi:phage baseplate assembly protein W
MASIKTPFQFNNGRLMTTTDPGEVARQKIVDVLTTSRFERVMRHSYGVDVKSLLFENIEELEFADFKTEAIQEMSNYLSRVSVLDIQIVPASLYDYYNKDSTTLTLNIVYKLPLGAPQVFKLNVAVPGSLNEDTPI